MYLELINRVATYKGIVQNKLRKFEKLYLKATKLKLEHFV